MNTRFHEYLARYRKLRGYTQSQMAERLAVCTVCDPEYSDCFGFSEAETKELLQYYGMELSSDVKAMYDGYLFGSMEVYNPWSVTFYAARKRLDPYWVNTSENGIIKHALEQRGESFTKEYRKLIEQGSVSVSVESDSILSEIG